LNFANRIKADISDLTLIQFRSNIILLTFHQLKLFQSQFEHRSASDASACLVLKKDFIQHPTTTSS